MRVVRLPRPTPIRSLEIEGPYGEYAANTRKLNEDSFITAVEYAAEAEADDAEGEGWTIWWGGVVGSRTKTIVAWLWPNDEAGGQRSVALLKEHLADAGFTVRQGTLPKLPPEEVRLPFVCRESGSVIGTFKYPKLTYLIDDQVERPVIKRQYEWPQQPCPHCSALVHPLKNIMGEPTRRAMMRIALGEAAAGGCCFGPSDEPAACCPKCHQSFWPQRSPARRRLR